MRFFLAAPSASKVAKTFGQNAIVCGQGKKIAPHWCFSGNFYQQVI
jgi:hypothetical protein